MVRREVYAGKSNVMNKSNVINTCGEAEADIEGWRGGRGTSTVPNVGENDADGTGDGVVPHLDFGREALVGRRYIWEGVASHIARAASIAGWRGFVNPSTWHASH